MISSGIKVASVQDIRDMEAHMINDVSLSGAILMENAANAVAYAVKSAIASGMAQNSNVAILCGGGNNGGDGLALLHILISCGIKATAILVFNPSGYSGDAKHNYEIAVKAHLPLTNELKSLKGCGVIVDAIFGTGLDRDVFGAAYEAITYANAQNAYKIAVDIPSGINGDSGRVMGCVFHADETITFNAIKRGLLLTSERAAIGKLTIAPIGVMTPCADEQYNRETLIDETLVRELMPKRSDTSNKGNFGKALMVVGSCGMTGAAIMSSRAAVRAGAGLTKALIPEEITPSFSIIPEVMTSFDEKDPKIDFDWATSICIGCGMGVNERTKRLLILALQTQKPIVIDADALNTVSKNKDILRLLHSNVVITPHVAEMSRLIDKDNESVINSFADTAIRFASEYGCNVLLKSSTSVIASCDGALRWNTSGNSSLAKGGSGDVLAGITTGLMAQGLCPFDAASAGAYLLGVSAERALDTLGRRALTATDIIDVISGKKATNAWQRD